MKLTTLLLMAGSSLSCLVPMSAVQAQSISALRSIADLKKLDFKPAAPANNSGTSVPRADSVLSTFQLYHSGFPQVADWNWEGPRSLKDIQVYKQASTAVVFLQVDTGQRSAKGAPLVSQGTGSILYPDGLILTAWHVVRDAMEGKIQKREILVFLKPANETTPSKALAYKAEVEYWNETKDLAVLHFVQHPTLELTKLRLGNMDGLAVGQDIHVIGHPGEFYWTYTTGIISQIRHGSSVSMRVGGTDLHPVMQSVVADMLQVQTAINPGNSGGPVLDDAGNIIGVVSSGDSSMQNTNFAIGASEIVALMQRHDRWMSTQKSPGALLKPSPLISKARTSTGIEVTKYQYPNYDVYLIEGRDGKASEIIVDGGGTVVRGQEPTGTGGFARWSAQFPDGSKAEATGMDGYPTAIQERK